MLVLLALNVAAELVSFSRGDRPRSRRCAGSTASAAVADAPPTQPDDGRRRSDVTNRAAAGGASNSGDASPKRTGAVALGRERVAEPVEAPEVRAATTTITPQTSRAAAACTSDACGDPALVDALERRVGEARRAAGARRATRSPGRR